MWCWTWALWYAHLECPCCNESKIIPFTCWSRFCFSCSKPTSDKRTHKLLSRLPTNISYRHIFFTIPSEFRKFFAINRRWFWHEEALNILSAAANETLKTFFMKQFWIDTPWFISVIHTFWAALNRNPHIHYIVPEWWFKTIWKNSSSTKVWLDTQGRYMHYKYFIKIRRAILAKHLRAYAKLHFSDYAYNEFSKLVSTTYADKDRCVFVTKGKASHISTLIWYLGRYLKRPVIWISRILDYDGENIIFEYYDKSHKKLEKSIVSAEAFLWLLARHIPDRNLKYVRYGWFFANRCKSTYIALIKRLGASPAKIPYIPLYYADRLWRSFGLHPLKCSCWWFFELIKLVYPNSFIDSS